MINSKRALELRRRTRRNGVASATNASERTILWKSGVRNEMVTTFAFCSVSFALPLHHARPPPQNASSHYLCLTCSVSFSYWIFSVCRCAFCAVFGSQVCVCCMFVHHTLHDIKFVMRVRDRHRHTQSMMYQIK